MTLMQGLSARPRDESTPDTLPLRLWGLWSRRWISVVSMAVGLTLWWALAQWVFPSILFAGPQSVVQAAWEMGKSGELVKHSIASVGRILAGFAVGSIAGIGIGLLAGSLIGARKALEPYINLFRFIPPIALLPLAILWFGIGEMSKVALIIYTTTFVVALNVMAGVSAIPPVKRFAAHSLGIRGVREFWHITVPATVPFIVTGTRIAMGNSFMTIVAAEMLAADQGLGYLIFSSRVFYETGKMFTGLLGLGILGFLTDRLFVRISKRWLSHYAIHS